MDPPQVRLQEAERNQSGLIRLTAQATAEVNKVRQTWARLTEREGREPSEKEMLSELGWPLSKLQRANAAFKILNRPISLESSRQGAGDQGVEAVEVDSRELGGEDDDGTESFTASWPRTAEEVVERELMQRAIEHDIGHRAKMVMTMRHGLKGGEKRATLQEVGKAMKPFLSSAPYLLSYYPQPRWVKHVSFVTRLPFIFLRLVKSLG